MFDFCPNCGNTIGGQDQVPGQVVICSTCGWEIGTVKTPPQTVVVDRTEEILQSGKAARCPACQQVVDVKISANAKTFVPHFQSGQRKMCPRSGKPVAADKPSSPAASEKKPPASEKLAAHYTRESIRVIACRHDGEPTIELLSLEYLDKSDRVRLQIETLRDILGKAFAMKAYPSALGRPQLAVWGHASAVVVAKKHDQGGYQTMSDAELKLVVEDLRNKKEQFF